MIRSKLYGLLESEAPEFRAAPFWAWNGELTEPELRRQIRDMHRMGFGGFFMHSRVGLRTPYLSKAWFDAIKVCVDEAEKNNMKAWLFDEDRWPSGTCGGEVTRDLRYALQGLDYKLSNRITPPAANSIGRYAAAMRNGEVFSCRLLNDRDELRPGEKFLHIFRVFDDTFDNDNNMAPMVDTMNPEAIRRFIELTHEKYAREVGDDFGSRIPDIFTDEPRYFIFCHSKSPWTTAFPEKFKEKYGYDLLPRLPELFFLIGGEAVSKLRLDFYNLASELFCNAFAKQVGEWCGKHHLALTGHALGEEDLLAQRDCIGSAMRFYEHQQQPGIDVLTEHWNAFDAPIQCSSVARQMGRKHCLSEMYAGLNWETRFEAIKAVAEWQAALGIDTRCPHLALYSMDGEAKRDFPPSFLSQAPWFKEYKMVEDHFARLHTVWSWGKSVRETLVIHPLESVFFYKPPCRMKKEKTVNRGGLFVYTGREKQNEQQRMIGVRNLLLSQHIAFDYGDEDMMSRMGSLCDGRLRVGEIAYRQVVIPKIRTIRASTLKLLNGFADNGGRVYYLGDAPEYVDGEKSGFARDSYKRFIPLDPRHVEVLNQKLPPPVSVCRVNGNREVGELLCDVHDGEGLTSLYMVNFSMSLPKRNHDQPAVSLRRKRFPRVEVKWRTAPGLRYFEFDLESGHIFPAAGRYENGCFCMVTGFERLQSRLFLASAEDLSNAPSPQGLPTGGVALKMPDVCEVRPGDENALLLDRPEWRINSGAWHGPTIVLKLDHHICKLQDRPQRDGCMLQPWFAETMPQKPIKPVEVELRYRIEIKEELHDLSLGIEHPGCYTFKLNGRPFAPAEGEWFIDPAIRRVVLPASGWRIGENILELATVYDRAFRGFEPLYLRGDFSVAPDDSLGGPVRRLAWGDWCAQGLKYYAGKVSYLIPVDGGKKGGRAALSIPAWEGTLLGVKVGDGPEQRLGWPPFATDVTLPPGRSTVTVTVYTGLRNLFGPFYMKNGFDEYGRDMYGRYPAMASLWYWLWERRTPVLMPCGLLGRPEMVLKSN